MNKYLKWSLVVIPWIVIVFFAGRGFQNWQTTRLATENQQLKAMLQNTQVVIQRGVNGKKISWQNFGDIGYNVLPDSTLPQGGTR